jgi:TonB family protein
VRAREILQPVLEEIEALLGDDALPLVPILMALGKADAAHGDEEAQVERYSRAIGIFDAAVPDDTIARANLSLEAGRDLFFLSRSSRSSDFLEDALDTFEDEFGPGDERTAIAAMSLGEFWFASNRLSRAEKLLLAALQVFTGKSEYQAQEFRIRTVLSEIYVRENRPDEATPHLVALEPLSVFSETQEYLPIVKMAPVYPPRAAGQGLNGYVVVQYTVTANGTVTDVEVLESSSPLFDRAAADSARQYRYVPRVINGELVEVPGVKTRIEFVIGP